MAVQVKFPDDSAQWFPGELYPDKYGFTIWDKNANPRHGQDTDFGPDHSVISVTPDYNVTDWSRRWCWNPTGAKYPER